MTRNDDETGSSDRGIDRRTALYGAGGTLAVGIAGCLGSDDEPADDSDEKQAFGDEDDSDDEHEPEKYRRDSLDEAFACDVDMDMRFTNRMQLDGDPTGGDRNRAVHVTSHGEESGDYPCMAIDLQDHEFRLGKLREKRGLSYDFYGGKKARYAIPDEVFLILKLPTTKDQPKYVVVYRKKDVGKTGQWERRDVSSEFTKDGWRAVEIDPKHIDVENERVLTTTEIVESRIEDLRHADVFANILETYGHDARVVAVAVGAGRLTGRTITDHYFDNVTVGDKTFTVPAMLSVDVDFTHAKDDGTVTATLSWANPAGDEYGVDLGDIDPESVRLSRYASIAPPMPGTDTAANAIAATGVGDKTADGIDVTFDGEAVAGLLEKGRETTVLIYGAFAGEKPYTFLGVTELEA